MRTKSYFSRFILLTAPTPSTATSIVHPNTCKNLLDSFRLTASSSTRSTRGGTAHPGTNVERRTRSFCDDDVDADAPSDCGTISLLLGTLVPGTIGPAAIEGSSSPA